MADPILLAKYGHTEYFKQVVVDSDLLNLRDAQGDSILSVSVKSGHFHCSKVILQKCPSLLYLQTVVGTKSTALHYAVNRGKIPIVKLLIDNAEKQLLRMVDRDGAVPLQKAVENRDIPTVKLLIEKDMDYEYQATKAGETPLLASLGLSYGYSQDDVRVQIRQILLEKQPNQCKVRVGSKSWTALHHAAYKGDFGAVGDIIRYCPTCINLLDSEGKNFLHIAAERQHVDLMEYILTTFEIAGRVINRPDRSGDTPLDIAITSRNQRMVSCLEGLNKQRNVVCDEEREEWELIIPQRHVELYKKLVNQFGEILPDDLSKLNFNDDGLAWDDFFSVVVEMIQLHPGLASKEDILAWEEKAIYWNNVGLHVSWFQNYVTHVSDWNTTTTLLKRELGDRREVVKAKEDEIQRRSTELQIMRDQLSTVSAEYNELKDSWPRAPTLGITISGSSELEPNILLECPWIVMELEPLPYM